MVGVETMGRLEDQPVVGVEAMGRLEDHPMVGVETMGRLEDQMVSLAVEETLRPRL